MAGVTKYSYLKELVDPKIRTEIDGLPFSTEGYEHTKNILARKYGQISEVMNAYVENITCLPTISTRSCLSMSSRWKQWGNCKR